MKRHARAVVHMRLNGQRLAPGDTVIVETTDLHVKRLTTGKAPLLKLLGKVKEPKAVETDAE